jgi:hypothetical protein
MGMVVLFSEMAFSRCRMLVSWLRRLVHPTQPKFRNPPADLPERSIIPDAVKKFQDDKGGSRTGLGINFRAAGKAPAGQHQ